MAQRSDLPGLVADAALGAGVAYFEGFGRSPRELRTVARRTTDGWELTGRKIGVTRANDLQVIVTADAESGVLLAFVVEPGTAGVTVTRDDREVGKFGADAVATANVELNAVTLPESARLAGGDDLAVHRAVAALRIGLAAVLLGTARAELAYAADYANTRVAFGQPIAQYQGVAFPLVEIGMEIDTSRLLVWKAAADIETLTDVPTIVDRAADVMSRCQRTALEAGRHGINTLGGHGFIQDHPMEQWHRGSATLAGLDFDPLESDCVVL